MDLKAIGTRIKEAREAKGFTQEQLAEIVGLSSTHMSVIERGVKAPKLETFIKIANALNRFCWMYWTIRCKSLLPSYPNNSSIFRQKSKEKF